MTIRPLIAKAVAAVDANDVVATFGVACLGYGLERICGGLGFAAAGAVMIYASLRTA